MKRMFVLLLSIVATTAVFAQSSRVEARRQVLGGSTVYNRGVYNHRGPGAIREKQMMIDRINREFNWKIQAVKRDHHLRRAEKKRRIRQLERERDVQILQVRRRYY
jgi:hypothetical protein